MTRLDYEYKFVVPIEVDKGISLTLMFNQSFSVASTTANRCGLLGQLRKALVCLAVAVNLWFPLHRFMHSCTCSCVYWTERTVSTGLSVLCQVENMHFVIYFNVY